MQRSSFPPALFPLMDNFSFWNAFSTLLNKNPKKLSWSIRTDRVLLAPQSTHSFTLTPNMRSSLNIIFKTLTYANFLVCVVSTPILSIPGSHTNLQLGIESQHSLYTCSASNPRLRSTIIFTVLQLCSGKEFLTDCICSLRTSNDLYGSFVWRISAPRICKVFFKKIIIITLYIPRTNRNMKHAELTNKLSSDE